MPLQAEPKGRVDKRTFLSAHPFFKGLKPELIDQVGSHAITRFVKAGTVIYGKGDPGDSLFAVITGIVQISVASVEGKDTVFAQLAAGEIVGEIALLDVQSGKASAEGRRISVTQRAIGQMIGMSRESTNKQLRNWEERNWVRLERGSIVVVALEAEAAFFGGLRYGEGMLYTKNAGDLKVFWQGPSLGWDFGGDGARTMMLVYSLPATQAIYQRFGGIGGSAYFVGGFGMTALTANNANNNIVLVPIRSGVGLRLGANVGYLKFTPQATWNPF